MILHLCRSNKYNFLLKNSFPTSDFQRTISKAYTYFSSPVEQSKLAGLLNCSLAYIMSIT